MSDRYRERSIEEIMEDTYSDPWDTLLHIKDGKVLVFRNKDGKTFYTESYQEEYGDVNFPNGFQELLAEKTLEEQMDYFRIVSSRVYYKTSYGDITKEELLQHSIRLQDYPNLIKLVVKDRILVGVRLKGWWNNKVVLPSKCICTYYASDNDGSGTNEREDYDFLICIDNQVL